MIRFANKETQPLVRQMWQTCFDDTDEFLDILFKYKYKHENTLIYFEGDKAVASLQMLSYTITFYGEIIPFSYLAGLCTLPEYRNRGYMAQLIHKAHQVINERKIPLAILIPAEEWLFDFYRKYGYEQVFEQGVEPTYSLRDILDTFPDIKDAYSAYNALYKDKDFCVQKSFDDFVAMVEEQTADGFPEKRNLAGMARIMDETYLLNLYANNMHPKEFALKVIDSSFSPDSVIKMGNGSAQYVSDPAFDIEVDIRLLCRLLFGYKTDELGEPYKRFFPLHHPIMNQMLE